MTGTDRLAVDGKEGQRKGILDIAGKQAATRPADTASEERSTLVHEIQDYLVSSPATCAAQPTYLGEDFREENDEDRGHDDRKEAVRERVEEDGEGIVHQSVSEHLGP